MLIGFQPARHRRGCKTPLHDNGSETFPPVPNAREPAHIEKARPIVTARLIDGKELAKTIMEGVRDAAGKRAGAPPRLVALAVGDDDASSGLYLKSQGKAATRVGIDFEVMTLPRDAAEEAVLAKMDALNRDPSVSAVILQRPLPLRFDALRILRAMDPRKDVEGMHPENLGALVHHRPRVLPCTADAALRLFRSTGHDPKGLEVVVVGHSEIVGKPIALSLLDDLATVTVCHIGTRDLAAHTRNADVLFVAAGVPGLIRGDMVKPGVVVVDIGINRIRTDGGPRTVGDVDFDDVAEKAARITPVPGGVGPVTIAVLMENVLKCAASA